MMAEVMVSEANRHRRLQVIDNPLHYPLLVAQLGVPEPEHAIPSHHELPRAAAIHQLGTGTAVDGAIQLHHQPGRFEQEIRIVPEEVGLEEEPAAGAQVCSEERLQPKLFRRRSAAEVDFPLSNGETLPRWGGAGGFARG